MAKKPRPSKERYDHEKLTEQVRTAFPLQDVQPLTENQQKVFQLYHRKNLCLHGLAGTGKTFLSLYLALNDILYGNTKHERVYIVRSVVASRDIGFLPGDVKEKSAVYEAPYAAICEELTGVKNSYEQMKGCGVIEFLTTSFVRGITLRNCVVVVDEIQNMTAQELNSIITRSGRNCKIIFSGDLRQDDLVHHREKSGLADFLRILKSMHEFGFVEFNAEDIVRSDLVKSYIIARDNLERSGVIKPL
jgi:phosphate starvation-inducible protein PhoH